MKKLLGLLAVTVLVLAGCSDSEIASYNLSQDADYFRVHRKVTFVNNVTGEVLLTMQGNCSVQQNETIQNALQVICKRGEDEFQKHFLGLNDTTTYVVEQIDYISEDPYHYEIHFKPESIIPDIDLETSR